MTTRFRLRGLLDAARISQSELSRQTGLSLATVNRLSTNTTQRVDLGTLDRLSTALGCEPGDLIERAPERVGRRKRGK